MSVDYTLIREHQEVLGSDGGHVGRVDHVIGGEIELAKLDVVPPPTFNTVGTTFTPPPCSYYRNSGNAHIASRGVGC